MREPERDAPEPGFLDRWLVPLILCGVAATQMALAHRGGLSPWKGGGFGMFASADTPAMRFLTVEGVDQSGREVRIEVSELVTEAELLRWGSWPEPGLPGRVAELAWAGEYVVAGTRWSSALDTLRSENPGLAVPEGTGSGNWVRPVRGGDPEGAGAKLKAVRVRGWKMRYEPGRDRVVTDALGETVVRGEWP